MEGMTTNEHDDSTVHDVGLPRNRGHWMPTFTDRTFYPMDPDPEDVVLEDIGHALSMICRYGGHTRRFYSVAEHTVAVSKWVEAQGAHPMAVQRALLHDAAEAYVGDMVRPLKLSMPAYRDVENRVLGVIGLRFGVGVLPKLDDLTIEADERILMDERERFLPKPRDPWWQDVQGLEPLGVYLHGHEPAQAERAWLSRAAELGLR